MSMLSQLPSKVSGAFASFTIVSFEFGVGWWVLLLLVPDAQPLLLTGSTSGLAWGFARVVGIVMVACLWFRFMRRLVPWSTWMNAIACLWVGSGVFAATSAPDMGIEGFLIGPLFFIASNGFVLLPATALTAWALVCADRSIEARPFRQF
jgi:hypothetical protein